MIWIVIILMALIGAPLFIVIGASAIYSFQAVDLSLLTFFTQIMDGFAKSALFITIPFFAFSGFLLAESNAPKRLVNLCRSMIGWLPGGLGIVAIVTCALFTAFTGASGVTIIALGGLLYPALARDNYPENFRLGLLTTCGSLGLLFPPSLPLILYALVASNAVDPKFFPGMPASSLQCNVNDLFIAALLPGFLLIILLSIYTMYVQKKAVGALGEVEAKKNKEDTQPLWKSLKEAFFELPLPFIIIGGIYGGYLTVDQAAAVLVVYVLVVEVLIYRDIKFHQLPAIVKKTLVLVGAIMIILIVAIGYSNYLIDERIPNQILTFMQSYLYQITFLVLINLGVLLLASALYFVMPAGRALPATIGAVFLLANVAYFAFIPESVVHTLQESIPDYMAFLIVLNVFLLIVGCLMDIFSAILIVVPIIVPIALKFGINPYHLGVIFLTNLEIGYSTPPVGINLFISSLRFKKPVVTLYFASIPFLVILVFALAFLTYVPGFSLIMVESELRQYPVTSVENVVDTKKVQLDEKVTTDGNGSFRVESEAQYRQVIKLYKIDDLKLSRARIIYQSQIRLRDFSKSGRAYLEVSGKTTRTRNFSFKNSYSFRQKKERIEGEFTSELDEKEVSLGLIRRFGKKDITLPRDVPVEVVTSGSRWKLATKDGELSVEITKDGDRLHAKVVQKFNRIANGASDAALTGNVDWQKTEVELILKSGEVPDFLELRLVVQGEGVVWLDDIKLLKRRSHQRD